MVVTTGAIAAAAGPLLIVIGKILTYLPKIKVAIAAVTGPVGLAIGAIVLMIANIPRVLNNVIDGFKLFAENIKTIFGSLFYLLRGDLDSFFGAFQKQFEKNINWARGKDRWASL